MPDHGGDLSEATRRFGEPEGGWLDLSTGINPLPYPVPEVPPTVWHRLPEEGDGLMEAAAAYYGTRELIPVPGSQAAIAALPYLRRHCRVAVLWPTYAEHAYRWERAGHQVERITQDQLEAASGEVDVVVLGQPNNPDGKGFAPEQLRHWRRRLARREGWLVVDEAFADTQPGASLVDEAGEPGLVVLRSMGKFFGLAGARLGFVAGHRSIRDAVAQELGPWPVSGPARLVGRQALADEAWQRQTRVALAESAQRLDSLLRWAGLQPSGGTELFRWVTTDRGQAWQHGLARHGVWVRCFREPTGLRFGLPGNETGWNRLWQALAGASA
ncbi:threonine-phosphate decarboxylase CobD [Thiohalorhabdus sp.]|uniref:threonine-phosphate decarboxylase CobD n=1 Tax=Thiohalorhabdus sp. TaxID=3094134 RepID=UPI002FC39477